MTYSTSPSRRYSSSPTDLPYIPAQSSIPPLLTLFGTAAPHSLTNFEGPFPQLPQVAFTFEVGILTNK
jgi:hypothetical protein